MPHDWIDSFGLRALSMSRELDLLNDRQSQQEAQKDSVCWASREMGAEFARLDRWIFGAGHDGQGLYNIVDYKYAVLEGPAGDYLVPGQVSLNG